MSGSANVLGCTVRIFERVFFSLAPPRKIAWLIFLLVASLE
jgi:hypothetical protein